MSGASATGPILVTGATGSVGRHVVTGLAAAGARVRALVREPERARLPAGVEVVRGDLTRPETLEPALAGVARVFLLWPAYDAAGARAVVERIAAHARRVVYLSAITAEDTRGVGVRGPWGEIERLVRSAGLAWTFLRASGFATNTLGWADAIRRERVVRWVYGAASRSLIHEADVAAVAVRALLEDRHVGATYVLTGPASIPQAEQVGVIAAVTGRALRWEELPPAVAREEMRAFWGDPHLADGSLRYWESLIADPEPVTRDVEAVTGRPARRFHAWVSDHAASFLPSTAEVADAYTGAIRAGRLDEAVQWCADDLVRIAPLEDAGRGERRGLAAVLDNARRLTTDVDVHHVGVDGPFRAEGPAADRFAVRFTFDETHRPTGVRRTTDKLSLYAVERGRIAREEVFYLTPPQRKTSDDR